MKKTEISQRKTTFPKLKLYSYTTIVIGLSCFVGNAQQSSLSSGGNALGAGGSASYSLGQVMYISNFGAGGTSFEGVQQPVEIYPLGINDFPEIQLEMMVYPNPTKSSLHLTIASSNNFNEKILNYQLYNLQGSLLESNNISDNEMVINLEKYPTAIYFLKVANENSIIKVFKIIKN
ncbi:MAG: hypothetical protein RL494_1113 [Bacteroidota bacterium]|jgi:hypothetical protein